MKRWEKFNETFKSNDSLEVQTAEIFCAKLQEYEERGEEVENKNALYEEIKNWLNEGVDSTDNGQQLSFSI